MTMIDVHRPYSAVSATSEWNDIDLTEAATEEIRTGR